MICALLTSLTACSTLDSLLEDLDTESLLHTHVYNQKVATENYLANDATCLEKATYYFSCECGDVGSTTFEQGFGKHEYSDWVSNGDNTHTKTCALDSTHVLTEDCSGGSATRSEKAICNECNTEYGEILGPSLENLFKYTLNEDNSSYTVNVFDMEIGLKFFESIDSAKDLFVDYEEIISIKEITIPSKYKGLPVTAIGDFAFIFMGIENITIPNTITKIGMGAFAYCSSLTSITIPESVTSIGEQAFECPKLIEVINKSPSITVIKGYRAEDDIDPSGGLGAYALSVSNCEDNYISKLSVDENNFIIYTDGEDKILVANNDLKVDMGILFFGNEILPDNSTISKIDLVIPNGITKINPLAFILNTELKTVEIPNSVTSIGEQAFFCCCSLEEIEIPNTVTSIGEGAFSNCSSLTSITIPDSVTSIGDWAFEDCDSLRSITVDENNTTYKSIDGNLYSKDGKTLIQYAIGKTATSFTIPDTVTSIGEGAFEDCSSLTSVIIPNSVTTIGSDAFYGCDSLTSITIPDSVTFIGMMAFAYCDSLQTIYCEATAKPSGWDRYWDRKVAETYNQYNVVWGYNGN